MSSVHINSAFTNSCIKMPVNPVNRRPQPKFERIMNFHSSKQLHTKEFDEKQENVDGKFKTNISATDDCDNKSFKTDSNFSCFVDFYDSIPDYRDINHLSKQEFYNKLEMLKRKQAELNNICFPNMKRPTVHQELHRNHHNDSLVDAKNVISSKLDDTLAINCNKNDTLLDNYNNDEDFVLASWKKENEMKKPNGKSVRINSGKSGNSVSFRSCTPFNGTDYLHDDYRNSRNCRSKSASPFRSASRLTVPKPFHMTQREEEDQMLDNFMMSRKCRSPNRPPSSSRAGTSTKATDPQDVSTANEQSNNNIIKANPVPLTSKIPLYKQIVAEQEHRNQLAKLNSAIELQSQIKPFVFTEKSERSPSRCLSRSMTSPCLTNPTTLDCDDRPSSKSGSQFRAKPCPKYLFSNYFYYKMWEDEYFRQQNRKLRAEELLKRSTLPPSMKKRDKHQQKSREPSERCSSAMKRSKRSKRKTKKKIPDFGQLQEKFQNELHEKQHEFITTCPHPFEFETTKRCGRKEEKPSSCQSNASSSKSSSSTATYRISPMPLYPAARPNLAANLRAEWARKKLREMTFSPEKTFPKEKLRRPSWGVRKSPAWKSLYYDNTNDEDISLRLATRRAEEKLRKDEHQTYMEMMKQRVRAAPLLLEGPTQWGPKVGAVTHDCAAYQASVAAKSKKQNFIKTTRPCSGSRHQRNYSKLSNYSDTRCASTKSYSCTDDVPNDDDDDLQSIDKSYL